MFLLVLSTETVAINASVDSCGRDREEGILREGLLGVLRLWLAEKYYRVDNLPNPVVEAPSPL